MFQKRNAATSRRKSQSSSRGYCELLTGLRSLTTVTWRAFGNVSFYSVIFKNQITTKILLKGFDSPGNAGKLYKSSLYASGLCFLLLCTYLCIEMPLGSSTTLVKSCLENLYTNDWRNKPSSDHPTIDMERRFRIGDLADEFLHTLYLPTILCNQRFSDGVWCRKGPGECYTW